MDIKNNELCEFIITFLNEAEEMFGERISDWKFKGLYYKNDIPHPPRIIYPENGVIKIKLKNKVIDNNVEFIVELAHEICHLLSPLRNINTGKDEINTVLNEGIAVYFSFEMAKKYSNINQDDLSLKPKEYNDAFNLVDKLMSIDKKIIKKIRKIEPKIYKFTNNHFKNIDNSIPDELLEELLKPFPSTPQDFNI